MPTRPPFVGALSSILLPPLHDLRHALLEVPSCLRDSDCFSPTPGYCGDLCTPNTIDWYGECPSDSGMCFKGDALCGECFSRCIVFKCMAVEKDKSTENDDYE